MSRWEQAVGHRKLLNLPGYSIGVVVLKTGKARNTIWGKLELLELPEKG